MRFAEVERLWHEVADAPASERERLLAAAEPDLRREVESLLAADDEAGDFLDGPACRDAIETGTRIGVYEIVAPLGSGGMGEVYRAHDPRLGREVALKILAPDLWDSPTAAARFAREARAASALNHPNIVHVYDVASEPAPFIAMELVEGETLRQKLRGPVNLEATLRALAGAARGLAKAHAAGIVHRDLKPENIMITPAGEAKLLDFGLAKVTAVAPSDGERSLLTTRRGLVAGTIGYMSPEQAQGERVDHRSDVFSFGCILFEVAAGRRPFESDSLVDTLHKIVHAPVPSMRQWNAALPRRLQALVERCLEKKPDARYQSMDDVAQALDDVLRRDARALDRRRASRVPRIAAAIVVTAVSMVISRAWTPSRATGRVAVLPFATAGVGDYLGEGFAAGLAERLGRAGGIEVAPHTAVRELVQRGRAGEVQASLRVATMIDGRVERRGDRLSVTARMPARGWQTTVEGALTDVPRLERELARSLAGALGVHATTAEDRALIRADTASARAYDAFLRARYEWNRWTDDGWQKAIELYEEAVIADPLFAAAHAGLSDSYTQLALYGMIPPERGWTEAKAAALRALELDPDLGEAHMSLGTVRTWREWDFGAAEESYRKAITLSPRSPEVRLAYALHLGAAGRAAEGVREAERAVELNPVSLIAHRALADLLMILGDLARYEAQARRLDELHPREPNGAYHRGLAAQWLGNEEEAFRHLLRYDRMVETPPSRLAAREAAFRRGGIRAYWRMTARDDEAAGLGSITLATEYALAGNYDRALQWIERGVERREAFILWTRSYPMFAPLRGDPRYEALIAKMTAGAP